MTISFVEFLEEKLIILNRGARYGQIVFMVGGAGSGKGFAINKFIEGEKFKVRDIDEWKRLFLKLDQLYQSYPEIRGLNLRNPGDVLKLHEFVKGLKIKDKTFDLLLKDRQADRLPNIIFDETLADMDNLYKFIPKLIEIGYEPQNIHIVWVLTEFHQASKQNAARSRQVAADILLHTHVGAATNMFNILSGRVSSVGPAMVNGEIVVVMNQPGSVTMHKDNKTIKDFKYVRVKTAGHPIDKDKAGEVINQMQNYIPNTKQTRKLFA